MASIKVEWTKRAEKEFLNALDNHISRNKSNRYSEKLIDKVELSIERISLFPGIGRIADDQKRRIVVIDSYLLIYELRNEIIYIDSFWNSYQNPEKRIDIGT